MTHRHRTTTDEPRAREPMRSAETARPRGRDAGRPCAHHPHEAPPSPLASILESAVAIVSITVVGLVSAAISAAPL